MCPCESVEGRAVDKCGVAGTVAALQAVSDPASLDRGLAGGKQEVHQLRLCQAEAQALVLESFPSRFLLIASPAPQQNRMRMEGCRASGSVGGKKKEAGQKQGNVCVLFAVLVLLHKNT